LTFPNVKAMQVGKTLAKSVEALPCSQKDIPNFCLWNDYSPKLQRNVVGMDMYLKGMKNG
jgi:hypothetical protein